MASTGVSLIEIQIPFSDPSLPDRPFLSANQKSLDHGPLWEDCFSFALI
jgi:tryptophan synthase alpha subunit